MSKIDELKERVKKYHSEHNKNDRYDLYFHPSEDQQVLVYSIVFSKMQSGAGLAISEGWNALNGKRNITVIPVRQWRCGYSPLNDDYSNRYKFKEISGTKGVYKLLLEDGNDVFIQFEINFNKNSATLKNKIIRAERVGFSAVGWFAFPGLNAPKTWPKRFTMPSRDSFPATIKEICQQLKVGFDQYCEYLINDNFAAFTVRQSIYQDNNWHGGLTFTYNAIYGLRIEGDEAVGVAVEADIAKDKHSALPGHHYYSITRIKNGVLEYKEGRISENPDNRYIEIEKEFKL